MCAVCEPTICSLIAFYFFFKFIFPSNKFDPFFPATNSTPIFFCPYIRLFFIFVISLALFSVKKKKKK